MSDPNTTPALEVARPLKPRPILFRILLGAMLLWIGALLWMYFATVHNVAPPSRHIILRMPAADAPPATNPR